MSIPHNSLPHTPNTISPSRTTEYRTSTSTESTENLESNENVAPPLHLQLSNSTNSNNSIISSSNTTSLNNESGKPWIDIELKLTAKDGIDLNNLKQLISHKNDEIFKYFEWKGKISFLNKEMKTKLGPMKMKAENWSKLDDCM